MMEYIVDAKTREGETSITSDEARGNKRGLESAARARIILETRARALAVVLSFSRLRSFSSRTRNEIMSDVLDARSGVIHYRRNMTALFDGAIFHVRSAVYDIATTFLDGRPSRGRPFNKAHRSTLALARK